MAGTSLKMMLGGVAAMLAAHGAGAQTSRTCEYAVAGWFATQLDLGEARTAYRACTRARASACTAEQGRVRTLEQQLRLLRQYLDGYCRR